MIGEPSTKSKTWSRPAVYRERSNLRSQCPGEPNSLVVEDEREHHVHQVLGDFALVDLDVLFLDPRRADVSKRLPGPSDACLGRPGLGDPAGH